MREEKLIKEQKSRKNLFTTYARRTLTLPFRRRHIRKRGDGGGRYPLLCYRRLITSRNNKNEEGKRYKRGEVQRGESAGNTERNTALTWSSSVNRFRELGEGGNRKGAGEEGARVKKVLLSEPGALIRKEKSRGS